mgnify:CR=1
MVRRAQAAEQRGGVRIAPDAPLGTTRVTSGVMYACGCGPAWIAWIAGRRVVRVFLHDRDVLCFSLPTFSTIFTGIVVSSQRGNVESNFFRVGESVCPFCFLVPSCNPLLDFAITRTCH